MTVERHIQQLWVRWVNNRRFYNGEADFSIPSVKPAVGQPCVPAISRMANLSEPQAKELTLPVLRWDLDMHGVLSTLTLHF